MERLDELRRRVAELEQAAIATDNLLLDAACQGGLPFTSTNNERCIDTCALSTWEDICLHLAERGRLRRINDRVYEIVDGT